MLGSLQEEAVRRGLYRYMGQRYAKLLETVLCRTRQCISLGRMQTEDELRLYLIDLAPSLVRFRDLDLVVKNLLIEARETDLFSLVAQLAPRAAEERQTAFHQPRTKEPTPCSPLICCLQSTLRSHNPWCGRSLWRSRYSRSNAW